MNLTPLCKALAATLLAAAVPVLADVKLPAVFSDHLVFQQEKEIPVWGWAEPGEAVEVKLGDATAKATANDKGEWRVALPALKATATPLQMTVSGKNRLAVGDILVGEVWLCSGQSNMEMRPDDYGPGILNKAQEKAACADPQLRFFSVPKVPSAVPLSDTQAVWQAMSPETFGSCSACAHFFGRELRRQLKVPVGLVVSAWGGTLIEPWTPPEGFAAIPACQSFLPQIVGTPERRALADDYLAKVAAWSEASRAGFAKEQCLAPPPPFPAELKYPTYHQQPCMLFNGMLKPVLGYALRGAIWYQGESNRLDEKLYTEKMKALVGGWRQLWGQGEFPFYFVQIAPYHYNDEAPGILPPFWVAQEEAEKSIPGTGMAVISDVGNPNDIHPGNKQEAGRRLALLALANTYGQKELVCRGPRFKEVKAEGAALRVSFDNAAGLKTCDGKAPSWFEVAGPNGKFVPAQAKIDGESVVVQAEGVAAPVAVRFGWHKIAVPNLANGAGLPGTAFLQVLPTALAPPADIPIPEAKEYRLAYDLDLAGLEANPAYAVDTHLLVGPFTRVAYFLELKKPGQPLHYLYVSMDAFTKDAAKIAIPTLASRASFQTAVASMNVVSDLPGLPVGTGRTDGYIEFWPNNYDPKNTAKIPGASEDRYDFSDNRTDPEDGYGCMQVHAIDAKTTLFSINSWKKGREADIGIGNGTGEHSDWTFSKNAGSYEVKRLRILVK